MWWGRKRQTLQKAYAKYMDSKRTFKKDREALFAIVETAPNAQLEADLKDARARGLGFLEILIRAELKNRS